jgi:hypothetical protein
MSGADGAAGEAEIVRALGHRQYVGGLWEQIGRLQFEYLMGEGLRQDQVFLDIGCGALRGGIHFIPFLDPGHYLGIEQEQLLVDAGLAQEMPAGLRDEKQPEFVISSEFEFDRLSKRPDYALAQSLFTHLTPERIEHCLGNLRSFAGEQPCRLYATFLEAEAPAQNPSASNPREAFLYTRAEMKQFGGQTNWAAHYVGEWGHPRGQQMMVYLN